MKIKFQAIYLKVPRMSPNFYQEYTKKLYDFILLNQEIPEFVFIKEPNDNRLPWLLLGCDMVLKNGNLEEKVYQVTSKLVCKLLQVFNYQYLTTDHWNILTAIVRKIIKRLRGTCRNEILGIIKVIRLNVDKINPDCVLKLLLTCKDFGINFKFQYGKRKFDFENFLDSLYFNLRNNIESTQELEEFYFIKTDSYEVTCRRRVHRLLFLLNPNRAIINLSASFEYWFELFSVSDKELTRFMSDLLICNQVEFAKLYVFVIVDDKLSVDFFIDQLLTDSSQIFKLILLITNNIIDTEALNILKSKKYKYKNQSKAKDVQSDVINYHTLLLLKLETIRKEFISMTCVDFKILIKSIKIFLNKLKN